MKGIESALFRYFDRRISASPKGNVREAAYQLILQAFSVIGMILLGLYSAHNFFMGIYIVFIVDVIAFLVLLINMIYALKTNDFRYAGWIAASVFFIVCLFLYIHGGVSGLGYTWSFLLPPLIILMLGNNRGTVLMGIFLALVVVSVLLPQNVPFASAYPAGVEIRFLIVFVCLVAATYVFEHINHLALKQLEESVKEVQHAKKSRDEFISKLSHQIRTPLNNIAVLGNILSESSIGEKQKDLLDTLIASTSNMVSIVNNIAKVSSIEITESGKDKDELQIRTAIENTVEFFTSRDPRKVQINIEVSEGVPHTLIGNPIRLKQIILNLIENMIQAINNGEFIARISVDIKEAIEEKIYVIFEINTGRQIQLNLFSIPAEMTGQKGIDLGVARRLIEAGGGSLSLRDKDKETIVTFFLPFERAKDTVIRESEERIPHFSLVKKTAKTELKDSNVLLVEDNLINQKIVQLSLQKMVRNIDVANNGKEALDKFGISKYDIILMDIQMPVMDGLIATKKIRELESSTHSHIPIIAITANALLGDKETCIAAGMDDYISKPFQMQELADKMGKLLSGGTASG